MRLLYLGSDGYIHGHKDCPFANNRGPMLPITIPLPLGTVLACRCNRCATDEEYEEAWRESATVNKPAAVVTVIMFGGVIGAVEANTDVQVWLVDFAESSDPQELNVEVDPNHGSDYEWSRKIAVDEKAS